MLKRVLTGFQNVHGRTNVSAQARQVLSNADAARDGRDWKSAAKLYREYLGIVQHDAAIWTQLGHALKEFGNPSEAEAAYRTGLAFSPQDAELHLQLGHLLKVEGRLQEAQRSYLHSSALDPTLGAQTEIEWQGDHLRQPPARPEPEPVPVPVPEPVQTEPTAASDPDASAEQELGDAARDRGAHAEAAGHYRAFLTAFPEQAGTWIQLGHMLRNVEDTDDSEAAYKMAIELDAADADAPFQLGFLQWRQGRTEEAHDSFRHSLRNGVLPHALRGMLQTGFEVPFESLPPSGGTGGRLFIEITDLITVISRAATISGIQRVQVNLVRHIVENGVDAAVVFWEKGLLWSVQPELVRDTVALFERSTDFGERAKVIARMVDATTPVRPGPGDQFVVTGAFWIGSDPTANNAKIKRSGASLGAYIYDFIPLTTPEFVPQGAIDEFSHWMAELMLQLDFALTISDFVGMEFRRLRADAGLPPIPVETVPLAHELSWAQAEAADSWTELTSHLVGTEFVLCVGSIAAHKNHLLVVQVWRVLLEMGIEPPVLVFAGKMGFGIQDLRDQLRTSGNLGDRVLVAEGLSDAAITTLYRHCLFTVFPSFTEGWGLPVGEALAHGKLCFASKMASIPEVGGSFVTLIDPYNARGTAEQIAAVLKDRRLLAAKEAQIRSDFQIRTWAEFGALFTQALQRAAPAPRGELALLPPKQVLQVQGPRRRWTHGPALPSADVTVRRILGRTILSQGWHPAESWGCWMNGSDAVLTIPTGLPAGTRIRVVVQCLSVSWQRRNRLKVVADGSAGFETSVPGPGAAFLAVVDAPVRAEGEVALRFEVEGALQPTPGELRSLGIGVRRVLYHALGTVADRLAAGDPVRPTTLIDKAGHSAVATGRAAMIEAARRTAMLRRGWLSPEAWGTWMGGSLAELSLMPDAAPGTEISVVLRLRSRASAGGSVTVTPHGAGRPVTVVLPQSGNAEVMTRVSGRVAADGSFGLTLRSRPAWARVGVAELFWMQLGEEITQSALLNSLMFGAERQSDDSDLLARDISFVVAGHLAGTYSLAAVNRRMLSALDDAMPGRVQALQVEGQPLHDMSGLLGATGSRIGKLAFNGWIGEGPMVMICQHWPIIPPAEPSDLPLAYVFWEESVVPRDVIETLNQHFRGVLSPARSVSKALIDSGLSIPVRFVGYAPHLAPFLELGQARIEAMEDLERADKPFTFLHVSSCFPRKGVDVLLAAYAKAFTRDAQVRLIIKTFPNPHNTVADQLAKLRDGTNDLPAIDLINSDLPEDALLELYRSADCMVLPTRGEGFNMPAAEAMAAGLPLIVTGAGGHMDFLDPADTRLLDYRFTHSQTHIRSASSVWLEPDVDDLCAALQAAVRTASRADVQEPAQDPVMRSMEQAVRIGDAEAWAARIKDVAVELLGSLKASRSRVAWVSTWMVRCGIAEYSRHLLENYPGAAEDVVVLCDSRSDPAQLAGSVPSVRKAWTVASMASMDRLAAAIEDVDPATVVIQHHHALISWSALPLLLRDERVRSRSVVITLHNTQQILDETPEVQKHLVDSLGALSRIVVHGVADLNLLKRMGLSLNTVLVPQGVTASPLHPTHARTFSPSEPVRIGSYGFFLPPKGLEQLIAAFAMVRQSYPQAVLRLVNAEYPDPVSTNLIAQCRSMAAGLGLDGAIEWHTEFLDDRASLNLMHECDLVVLPYQHTRESSSAAVRTALASRVPVVVTPLPIFEELEDAVLRLKDCDIVSIASGVTWLLDRPDARTSLMHAADRWRDNNNWAIIGQRFQGMIEGLLSEEEG